MDCKLVSTSQPLAQFLTTAADVSVPAVQKQDDQDAGRASASEGQVREETVPPNVRVMQTMLRELDDDYGGIMGYLRHIGLTAAEARRSAVPACGLPTVLSLAVVSCHRFS